MKLSMDGFKAYRLRHGNSIDLEEAANGLLALRRRAIRGARVCDIVVVFRIKHLMAVAMVASTRTDPGPLCTRDLGRHRSSGTNSRTNSHFLCDEEKSSREKLTLISLKGATQPLGARNSPCKTGTDSTQSALLRCCATAASLTGMINSKKPQLGACSEVPC